MDVSRLLSPCLKLTSLSLSHESTQPGAKAQAIPITGRETFSASASSGDQQTSVTSKRTPSGRLPRTQPAGRKRCNTVMKAHTQLSQVPVKRKRKRRFSAQQKQVMRESQQDDSRIYNLTLDVNELKRQVHDLLMRKCVFETRELAQRKVLEARALVTKQLYNAAVLRTTQRFFEIFRTGFREWEPEEDAFLAAMIGKNISIASGVRGTDAFFEQWRQYSNAMRVRSVVTSSTNILVNDAESCVAECNGEVEGALTLEAIKMLFPDALQIPELLNKVIDCHLVCPTRTLLYFGASGRIMQYDADVDMFAGLSHILAASPMEVITLMANTRGSAEGMMIADLSETNPTGVEASDLTPPSPLRSTTTTSSLASVSQPTISCSSRSSVGYILS